MSAGAPGLNDVRASAEAGAHQGDPDRALTGRRSTGDETRWPPAFAGARAPFAVASGERGFTLVELMIVVFIIGLVAGVVVLSLPGDGAALSEDADRFAARVAAARDQAVIGAAPVAVWVAPSGYGFEVRRDRAWQPLDKPNLANRDWRSGTVARVEGTLAPAAVDQDGAEAAAASAGRTRFWFDTTGLPNAPVTIALQRGEQRDTIAISATGEVQRAR